MHINRHNYESFFLLYIDNELTAAERKTVDAFLKANPDLAAELEQLQRLTLPAETVLFPEKETLQKLTSSFTDEMQELMLRKLDAELNEAEAKEWSVLMQEIELQKEWDILTQTKLDKDEYIPFADKSTLYRKEEASVFSMNLLRWTVAAAIIGMGLFIGIRISQSNHTDQDQPVIAVQPTQKSTNAVLTQKNVNGQSADPASITQQAGVVDTGKEYRAMENSNNQSLNKRAKLPYSYTAPNNSIAVEIGYQTNEEEPLEQITLQSITETNRVLKVHSLSDPNPEVSLAANAMEAPEIRPMDDLNEQQNLLAAAFATNPDANRILYMNEEVLKETKLGQFVKRTKESIENKTQIKTGKGLKIGNFEIAIR